MSIRKPVKADMDTRNAFTDVEDELADLWRAIDRLSVKTPTETPQTEEVPRRYIDAADFGSGNSPAGSALISDGNGDPSWGPVAGGLLTPIPAGSGERSLDQQALQVNGSLVVLGAASAETLRCRNLVVHGDGGGLGQQILSVGYGGAVTAGVNACSGTAETILPGYAVVIPANTLHIGDTIFIEGLAINTAATAGTKYARVYLGGSGALNLVTTTSVDTVGRFTFRYYMKLRGTTAGCNGTVVNGSGASTTSATTDWNSASLSSIDMTTDMKLQFTVQGAASSQFALTDLAVLLFRGNGVVL